MERVTTSSTDQSIIDENCIRSSHVGKQGGAVVMEHCKGALGGVRVCKGWYERWRGQEM